jgi:hypothetical protein
MKAIYRYPGVKPFEATDTPLFFGRKHDQAVLFELVKREKLLVLFGKSGYGKSSLLQAGLIPDLLDKPNLVLDQESGEDQIIPNLPIYIRLNLYGKTGPGIMPLETVLNRFRERVGADDSEAKTALFFSEHKIAPTLWTTLKSSKTAATQAIFLIFDQFEEFFSYPFDAQLNFRSEISELLYTRIPQTVRDEMADLDRATKRLLHRPLNVHVVLAIRSDRIHLLNSMRDELPAILQARYELKALNERQAREAIVRPAQIRAESLILSQPFEYAGPALKKILSELGKPSETDVDQEAEPTIEAFQLQMVCQTIEQSLIAGLRKKALTQPIVVHERDLPDFAQIYEKYYTDKLASLADNLDPRTAHILLEEVMAIGEDLSDLRRVSIDKDLLIETMQRDHRRTVTQDLLDCLEDKFLIRRETIGGRVHYEITHDVLLAPLLKSREAARQKDAEAIAAAEARQQQAEAEQRAREAEKRAERERHLRRQASRWAFSALAGFLLALAIGLWALQQKQQAEFQLAQNVALEQEKQKAEFYHTMDDIEVILESPDGCPNKNQKSLLDTIPPKYGTDTVLQKRVRELRLRIEKNNCTYLQ